MTKTYHVSLTVEVLACLKVDDDWPEDAVSLMAHESISLLPIFPTGQGDVFLEVEHIEVNDIVKITRDQ